MKKTIFTVAFAAIISAVSFSSCTSSEQKTEPVQTKTEEPKQIKKDTVVVVVKTATPLEWTVFKSEAEAMVKANEIRIKALKDKIIQSSKEADMMYEKNVILLEQQNTNLKMKIDNYEKNKSSDWETFKGEFNHDISGLGQALKDFTVNNKK